MVILITLTSLRKTHLEKIGGSACIMGYQSHQKYHPYTMDGYITLSIMRIFLQTNIFQRTMRRNIFLTLPEQNYRIIHLIANLSKNLCIIAPGNQRYMSNLYLSSHKAFLWKEYHDFILLALSRIASFTNTTT